MGACISSKPKKTTRKNQESLNRHLPQPTSIQKKSTSELSKYKIETMKVPASSSDIKKFPSFNSLDYHENFSDPIIQNEESGANTSLKSEEVESGAKKLSFHRRRYLRRKKSSNNKYGDSVSTTNATKNSSEMPSHVLNNFHRSDYELKEDLKPESVRIILDSQDSENLPFVNFGSSQNFLNQLILTSLKSADNCEERRTGPRRLTQTSMRLNPLPGNPVRLEIPAVFENSEELAPSSSLVSLSNIEVQPLKSCESRCYNSMKNQEIEFLDLSNDGSRVHIFQVPFNKLPKEKEQTCIKTVSLSDFDLFYKSSYIDEKLDRAPALLKLFPTRWAGGVVPYSIHKSLMFVTNSKSQSLFNLIVDSIHLIQSKTSIRFVSFNEEKHKNFLMFSLGEKNQALIGCQAGKNDVFLTQKTDSGGVLHQIMHSLGFFHEIQRKKLDSFVYLEKKQLKNPGFFEDGSHICLAGLNFGPYDRGSVMHYQSCEHMISFKPTVHDDEIGLSEVDIGKINLFYSFDKSEKELLEDLSRLNVLADKINSSKRGSLRRSQKNH